MDGYTDYLTVGFHWLLKFPEETEMELLSVTIDDAAHYPSCSVFSAPGTPAVFSPTVPFQPDDSRRDELSSTSSEDSDKEDEFDRDRPHSYYRRPGCVKQTLHPNAWQTQPNTLWTDFAYG